MSSTMHSIFASVFLSKNKIEWGAGVPMRELFSPGSTERKGRLGGKIVARGTIYMNEFYSQHVFIWFVVGENYNVDMANGFISNPELVEPSWNNNS